MMGPGWGCKDHKDLDGRALPLLYTYKVERYVSTDERHMDESGTY